jgi:hypothetical protein
MLRFAHLERTSGQNTGTGGIVLVFIWHLVTSESFWIALSTLGTLGLAFFTWRLAAETTGLVRSGASERDQLERHHRQTLMPIVYVNAEAQRRDEYEGRPLIFCGYLCNVGLGPSVSVNILLKPSGIMPRWFYRGAIGASSTAEFILEWKFNGPVPTQRWWPYDCLVHFVDTFGNTGAVWQRSASGLKEEFQILQIILPSATSNKEVEDLLTAQFAGEKLGYLQRSQIG